MAAKGVAEELNRLCRSQATPLMPAPLSQNRPPVVFTVGDLAFYTQSYIVISNVTGYPPKQINSVPHPIEARRQNRQELNLCGTVFYANINACKEKLISPQNPACVGEQTTAANVTTFILEGISLNVIRTDFHFNGIDLKAVLCPFLVLHRTASFCRFSASLLYPTIRFQ